MKKQEPKVEEGFILSATTFQDGYLLTISPEKESEGYVPSSILITTEQHNELRLQIESGSVFKFSKTERNGVIDLRIAADKFALGAKHNFKVIEISQEQWDGLRYSFMTGINDAQGITKLCYLQ